MPRPRRDQHTPEHEAEVGTFVVLSGPRDQNGPDHQSAAGTTYRAARRAAPIPSAIAARPGRRRRRTRRDRRGSRGRCRAHPRRRGRDRRTPSSRRHAVVPLGRGRRRPCARSMASTPSPSCASVGGACWVVATVSPTVAVTPVGRPRTFRVPLTPTGAPAPHPLAAHAGRPARSGGGCSRPLRPCGRGPWSRHLAL